MLTRRRFLKLSAFTGAGLLLPSFPIWGCGDEPPGVSGETATAIAKKILKAVARLDRFVDPLPVPARIEPDTGRYDGSDYYEIRLSEFQQEYHSQLPATTVWGYADATPGPVIEARQNRPVRVRWINDDLPEKHLLAAAIDRTIDDAASMPDVRTVAHLHGGDTPPLSDGLPDGWSSPDGARTGAGYNPDDFIYANTQHSCMLWFHDHAMATTRLNVYAGLAGLYIIRDENEATLGLPTGEYEIPLVIQDRDFNDDGSLAYPTTGSSVEHPIWTAMFLGTVGVVNGRAWPRLEVEPRRYRLRLLNASQARTWNLSLVTGGAPHPFHVIGSDGGFLPTAVPMQQLRLGPAERADLIVDFSSLPLNTVLTLANDAPAPYPGGGRPAIPELMQVRVGKDLRGTDDSTPAPTLRLPALPALAPTPGLPARVMTLDYIVNDTGATTAFLINKKMFMEPADERPADGTTEIWEFVNLTGDAHPVHLHLVQFQVLNRQGVDVANYWQAREDFLAGSGPRPDINRFLTGAALPPLPQEVGWKDTALVMPDEVLRLTVPFKLPPGTPRPARYIYHCHILEHEDNDMMRPLEVI
ncbi:MAG: multicopper oxidase family protein [Thermoleophilia bacterium]